MEGWEEEEAAAAAAAEVEGAAPVQVPSEAAMKAAAAAHMPRLDKEYESAVERYKQSLAIKADFYEAAIAWGQQAFERAKLYHVSSKDAKGAAKKKASAEADAMFVLAEEKFTAALAMLPAEEPKAAAVAAEEAAASTSGAGEVVAVDAAAVAEAEAAVEEAQLSLSAQILVLWGNVLFERSQVRHHREDKNWQTDCDAAVAKFNGAGCSKLDITRALMNHTSAVWKEEAKAEEAAKYKGK